MNHLKKISSLLFSLALWIFVTLSINSCGQISSENSNETAVEETADSTVAKSEHPEGGEHPEGSEHPEGEEHPEDGEHHEDDGDVESEEKASIEE